MLIFEGHLDIAFNALVHERDPLWTVEETRQRELDPPCDDGRGICTTSFPEMRAANISVAVTTLLGRAKPWVKPGRDRAHGDGDWPTQEMVYALAQGQLAYYRLLETQGHVRILETAAQLRAHWAEWKAAYESETDDSGDESGGNSGADSGGEVPLGLIITMECSDPIVEPAQLHQWYDQGLRALFLTHFGMGHYAAGNPSVPPNPYDIDGPVSPRGVELLREMEKLSMPLDLTHTSDSSFWDAIERYPGPVYSSHANCRAISNEQRQLTDDMIKAIIDRDGVLGVVLAINMIRVDLIEGPPWTPLSHDVQLHHLADHLDRICQLAGNADHVALGTDTDGGFGTEACPHGYDRHRDIHKLADILRERGYAEKDLAKLFHQTWLDFYGRVLP
ncbi:MAG: membrane dipeptidase [Planctomycetota bacterium]